LQKELTRNSRLCVCKRWFERGKSHAITASVPLIHITRGKVSKTARKMLPLALTYSHEDFEPVVLCGIVTISKSLQPAGRSFHETHEKPNLSKKSVKKVAAQEKEDESESELEETTSKKKGKQVTASFKLDKVLDGQKLYKLLEVREDATMDQIKQSYRKLVLEHHPDKLSPEERMKNETHFIRIQGAFEILSDAGKRRQYDSTLPFDESIPTSLSPKDDFYDVFGAAFERNARWSTRRPVPTLGDPATPFDQVVSFYDFWFSFESWRDFAAHDEHDTTQGGCREEKRWMERQNSKTRRRLQNEENGRILRLSETANRLDPRVIKQKQDELRASMEAKNSHKEKKAQAEREAKEAAERAKAEAARVEEEAKEKVKTEKADIKKCRPQIKQILRPAYDEVNMDEEMVANFLLTLNTLPEISGLLEKLKVVAEQPKDAAVIFLAYYSEKTNTAKTYIDDAKKKTVADTSDTWTSSEVVMFQKGLTKFPVGVAKRWEQIANIIGTRSIDEVIVMSKRFAEDKNIQSMAKPLKTGVAAPAVEDWSDDQQKALENALRLYPANGPVADRWEAISAKVDGKTKDECVARFRYLKDLIKK
jgi:DnaJ homolog subfamily C member 2